jgi:hypothetical protein
MGGGPVGSSQQPKDKKSSRGQQKQQGQHPMSIQPSITFTLSEDEATDDTDIADVENQLHIETTTNTEVEDQQPVKMETDTGSIDDLSPRSRTMTFTHLELMRHELAHQMQLAARDREIHALKQQNETLKVEHDVVLSTKDDEISRLKHALTEVEAVLSKSQTDLEVANNEQTKILSVLMDTQYKLHEEKNKSWISPWLSFFESSSYGLK